MSSFRLGLVFLALAGLMGARSAFAATPAELLATAEAKYTAGDYRGTLAACDTWLAAQPKSADALYWRARAHAGLQSPERALADLEAALRLNPKEPRYHVVKAHVLHSVRRYADSRRAAEAALALDPKRESALLALGLAQHELADHAGAEATFRQAATLHPRSALPYSSLGYLKRRTGDQRGALAAYDQALALDPGNLTARFNRSNTRHTLGDYWGAITDATEVLEYNPKDDEAYATRGLAYLKRGELLAARADLDQALALNPKNARATRGLEELKTAPPAVAAAPRPRVSFGDFSVAPAEGWDRAPPEIEQEQKSWSFGDLTSLSRGNDTDPLVVAFSFETMPYRSDAERTRALRSYTETVRKAHPRAFQETSEFVAGRPARRFRFVDDDGANSFYYAIDGGAAYYFVQVFAQGPADTPPPRAQELLATLSLRSPIPLAAGTAPVSPAAAAAATATLPVVVFHATDPCAAAQAAPARGMPWSPAATKSAPPPAAVRTAPFADLVKYSKVHYNAAVSMAMAGMRLAYGPLSAEETRAFEAAWVPLYHHPSQPVLDYLDGLTPLLGRYLSGREAWLRTAAALQAAILDASLAVAARNQAGWLAAMARADQQTTALTTLGDDLILTARAIEALGNPPNPLAAKCAASQRYRRSLRVADSPLDGEWVSTNGKERIHYRTLLRHGDDKVLVYKYSYAFADQLRSAGLQADKPGLETAGAGLIAVPGVEDTLLLLKQEPDGRFWYSSPGIGESYSAMVIDGERLRHVVYQPVEFMSPIFWFQGVTFHRAPPLTDQPPVLPGHTWDAIVKNAHGWAPKRLALFEELHGQPNDRVRALLAVDVDHLPPRPIVRQPEDEAPHPADQAPPNCTCHVCQKGDTSRCTCALCQRDRLAYTGSALPAENPPAAAATAPGAPAPAAPTDALRETIAFHESMIALLERNLAREVAELEQERTPERAKLLALRIVQLETNLQEERDLIASHQTGRLVHTRSAFDEYAQQKFIASIRQEATRIDQVRRIAAGIERQIELLPEEQRKPAREQAHRILDARVLADGDLERAKRLAAALDNQVQGYWAGQSARQDEKAVAAEEGEFWTNMAILASSACVVGLGEQAMMQTFGETAALTLWSPHLIGGIYGGMTGAVAGGLDVVEGLRGAASGFHTIGGGVLNFVDGYRSASRKPGASTFDAVWEGACNAGYNLLLEKGFEIGAKYFVQGAVHVLGQDHRLFQPLVLSAPGRQKLAALQLQNAVDEGKALVTEFQHAQRRLLDARVARAAPAELTRLEDEARRLAAALNGTYHGKWLLKYESHPSLQRAFDGYVQASYERMLPEMLGLLRTQGYDTSNLRFRQLRNASSAGTASMDLDFALVENPGLVIRRNGEPVELIQFQRDAQRALERAYHTVTGYSAARSELNLTTSRHGEAFSNPALLKKNVDFTRLDPADIAQIGQVLNVKLGKIANDPVMTPIAKMQASSRESTKEIRNMMLPLLRQRAAQAAPGSPQATQVQGDLVYWEGMLRHLGEIGTETTDPMRILELDRLIRIETGGKGTMEVVHDLTRAFGRP